MKLKDGFVLRQVAGETVVIPSGQTLDLNMMITLNETGRFLWERMEQETCEEELVLALVKEYEVDEQKAKESVKEFVKKLYDHGFAE